MKHIGRFLAVLLTLCLMLNVSLVPGAHAASGHPFTDLPGGVYDPVITTLWEYGIVSGLEPDKYVPEGTVTRAQMAALLVRAMGKTAEAELAKTLPVEFSDVPVGHWARGVIALANRMGIIKGDAGKFYPNDTVNYAQAATMLVRALGYEGQVTGGYPSGYVIKANELGLLTGTNFELYTGVNRAEAAVLLYNAVFRAPDARTGLTWSQSFFQKAATLTFGSTAAYAAPGQQIPLSAQAADREGRPIPGAAIEYVVTAGAGQINGSTLTVGAGGAITVTAKFSGLSATTTIVAVTDLQVEPASFQATKGGKVQLTASALSGGQRVAVQPEWRVTAGPASVSATGQVTVNDYGNVTVQAVLGSLTASSTGQAVGKINIGSKPEFLVPGLTYNLTATVADATGKTISLPVTWSATGANIDQTGRLTTPVGNQVVVKATAGGITEQVTIPVIKTIQVTPASATVLTGKTVTFSAQGVDSTGKTYPVTAQWSRTVPSVGIVDASGVFVGLQPGSTPVVAEVGSLRGQTNIQVSGQPARLSVTAARTSLPVGTGATSEITVRLVDQAGNRSPVDDQPISLTLTDSGRGSLSRTLVLTEDGEAKITYTAGSATGSASIGVTAPGTNLGSQVVMISTYQTTPTYLELTASPQPLAAGGGVATITATLRDANNLPAPAPQALYVTLSASGATAGSLTGTTITIPAGQSTGTISFISSGTPGTVQINGSSTYQVRGVTVQTTTAGPAAKVRIRPVEKETPVTGLSSLQVQVEVLDANGVMRANDSSSQVQLNVDIAGGSITATPPVPTAVANGGVATFNVPAYTVGTVTLTASLVGTPTATDTATAAFVPGVFSSLRLTAQPASLPADGYSQTQIIAEVVDRSGMLLSSVNPVITFRKLSEAGATTPLTDLRVQAAGGKAILTVQSTRLAGADTWYATAPGMDTQNLVTVTTAATSGDAYTLRVNGATSFAVGGANTITVQVVDQQGRLVTGDTGRLITATHNIPGMTLSQAAVMTASGTATFIVSGSQATTGIITFNAPGLTIPSIQSTVAFGTGATTAYSLFASTSPTTARYGTAVTIWVWVKDSQGNTLTTDSGRMISASVSGSATLSSNTAMTNGGSAVFTVTGTGPGTVTVTLTAPGLPQPMTTLSIVFTN